MRGFANKHILVINSSDLNLFRKCSIQVKSKNMMNMQKISISSLKEPESGDHASK